MILLGLVLSGCGSLNEVPVRDSHGLGDTDSGATAADDTGTAGTTDTDTFEADPAAPVVTTCDAFCWYHTTGEEFYEWNIDCEASDPEGVANIWNGRWACTGGSCADQTGLVACTADSGVCNTSFKEAQVTPTIFCEQASSYVFTVWVSDWEGHESKGLKITGRQQ